MNRRGVHKCACVVLATFKELLLLSLNADASQILLTLKKKERKKIPHHLRINCPSLHSLERHRPNLVFAKYSRRPSEVLLPPFTQPETRRARLAHHRPSSPFPIWSPSLLPRPLVPGPLTGVTATAGLPSTGLDLFPPFHGLQKQI